MQNQADLICQVYPGLDIPMANENQQGEKQQKQNRKRKRKREGNWSAFKKRKLSAEQVKKLEISFGCEHKLKSERKDRLASEIGLDPRQVAVWFQNRRARWKIKKLEEEYSELKNEHEGLVVENYCLETEVLNLKDQLTDAKKEIQRLLEKVSLLTNNVLTKSQTSSLSIDHHVNAMQSQLLGDPIGMGGYIDNMMYATSSDYVPCMDWVNLYYM